MGKKRKLLEQAKKAMTPFQRLQFNARRVKNVMKAFGAKAEDFEKMMANMNKNDQDQSAATIKDSDPTKIPEGMTAEEMKQKKLSCMKICAKAQGEDAVDKKTMSRRRASLTSSTNSVSTVDPLESTRST